MNDTSNPADWPPQSHRVLTLADSLADLAGEARPGDAQPVAWLHTSGLLRLDVDFQPIRSEVAGSWSPLYTAAPAPVAQGEPVAWRDHVEKRMRQWKQRTMNRSGDRLALDDFMDAESLDDLIDYVCDEWAGPAAAPAPVLTPAQSLTDELAEALREIADDYADRFDLDSPSTNPGIKFTIKQARAVLAKIEATGQEGGA